MTERKIKGGTIKIYGTSIVGAKGQIIIPKEIREEYSLLVGENLKSLIFDSRFLGLVKNTEKVMEIINDAHNKDEKCSAEIGESIKIGTNFQFVIPQNIRNLIGINSGDNMVFMGKENAFGIFKNDDIDVFFKYVKDELSK